MKAASGLRVLVVEDEAMIAMMIEDMLGDLGFTVVAIASRLDEAVEKASSLAFDVALLDVNLHGHPSLPVAETLSRRRIPFVFATGYRDTFLPDPLRSAPVLAKPFQRDDLRRALLEAIDLTS